MRQYQSLCLFLGLFLSVYSTPALAEAIGGGIEDLGGSITQNPESNQLTKVIGVELKQTPTGLQLILKTPPGQAKLVPLILPVGNNLEIELLDATLAFAIRNGVTKTNPAPGISEVRVSKVDDTSIRVTIAGAKQVPRAEIVPSRQNLVLSVIPSGVTAQSKPEEEIEIVVTGQREEDNYAVPDSNVGTRTNAAIKDVPQSIQVVPQQVLKDRQVTDIKEAVRNVSGVSDGGPEKIGIRGFADFDNLFSNGVFSRNSQRIGVNTTNVEQVEVLKGPASVLYGGNEPGGIINLVSKLPLKEPTYNIQAVIGNFDFYRPELDFSGPLNPDRTILYRLSTSYENSGSFIDFAEREQFSIFPVISFELGKDTTLTFSGSYEETRESTYPSLPAVGTVLPNPLGSVPISRNLNNLNSPDSELSAGSIGYQLEHKFNSNLSIRNNFIAESFKNPGKGIGFSASLSEDNRTVEIGANSGDSDIQEYKLQTDVIAKIETGKIKQDLLFGLDLRRSVGDNTNGFFLASDGSDLPSIDLFDPEYPELELSDLDFTKDFDGSFEDNYIAIYGQDLISFGDKLKLLLGGRFDWVTANFQDNLFGDFIVSEDNAFSPRVGIVYKPIEPISLYAGYSRSFKPEGTFGTINADGTPFEPTKGEQLEVGVKTEFFDGRASATLAVYQINKQNIIVDDPEREDFSIQIGEQRSRGIEFDLTGEVLPGLRLITTYSLVDAEITEDPNFVGNKPENIPRHSGSIWAVYEVPKGDYQGFGAGAGVFAVGKREGDFENTFELPAYGRTDALLYYRRDNWQAQLNFENLFDATYFVNGDVTPGAPFTVRGQLSAEF